MKNASTLKNVRECNRRPSEHQERKEIYSQSGKNLRTSILSQLEKKEFKDLLNSGNYPLLEVIKEKQEYALAQDPRWKDKRFGAVGLMGQAGCLVYTTYNMLYLTNKLDENTSVPAIQEIVENKGYRMWHFSHRKEALNWPEVTLTNIKAQYPEIEEVQKCTSIEDAEKVLGKPCGIGGSMYFLDEVIALVWRMSPYVDTRIWTCFGLLDNLHDGIPVPIRVNNRIYWNDEAKQEGHYTILVGFDKDGNAVLVDSHTEKGIYKCPYDRFFRAVVADPDLISAWNLRRY